MVEVRGERYERSVGRGVDTASTEESRKIGGGKIAAGLCSKT